MAHIIELMGGMLKLGGGFRTAMRPSRAVGNDHDTQVYGWRVDGAKYILVSCP